MNHNTKTLTISLVIFILTLAGFVVARDEFARVAYINFGKADVASVLASRDANLLVALGNHYFGGGEYNPTKAKYLYRKAIARDNRAKWAHYQLARIYFVEGDKGGALREIEKELAEYPENLRSLYIRGLIYGYRKFPGDLKKAEDDFRGFIAWAPQEWAGYNDLNWILAQEKKYEDIKEIVAQAFENVPYARESNPWLWNSLGVAYLNLGEYDEAEKAFKKTQEFANELTTQDWIIAYPGNDPAQATSGLAQFKLAIEKNMALVEER